MNVQIHRIRKIALGVSLAVVLIVGVTVVTQNAHKLQPGHRTLSLSIAKEYKTLAELRHDADVVALVSVQGVPTPSNRLGNIPTVDVQLRVEKVFTGTAQVGDNITLVQIGDPSGQIVVTDPFPPILQNGKRYVVYLNRQLPDQPQMIIAGQAGVFEAGTGAQFHRLGDASANLPKNATLDQF